MMTITIKTTAANQLNSLIDDYVDTYKNYLIYFNHYSNINKASTENSTEILNTLTLHELKLANYTANIIKEVMKNNGWNDTRIDNYLINNNEYDNIIKDSTKLNTLTRIKEFLINSDLNV